MTVSHLSVDALLNRVQTDHMGFFADADIRALAGHAHGRLTQVLVRGGRCRFVCAAQDVEFLEHCLTAGGDYIRDVSLPGGTREST